MSDFEAKKCALYTRQYGTTLDFITDVLCPGTQFCDELTGTFVFSLIDCCTLFLCFRFSKCLWRPICCCVLCQVLI